jgi:hypothetical protein
MIFITVRKKNAEAALIALCCLMALVTLVLLFFSLAFSFGGGAPNLFGRSVYLVKTDAFELIKNPGAVIARKAASDEITEKNIVIFEFDGRKAIGEVTEKSVSDTGVTYFTLADETGREHNVSEHEIIAKAVQYSAVLGVIVGFAVSPAGILVTAVTPCFCVLLTEALRPLLRRKSEKEEVEPINKQDETPTFVPNTSSAAALKAYKSSAGKSALSEKSVPQLFTSPVRETRRPVYSLKPAPTLANERHSRKEPLSSEKLARVIAATKAERLYPGGEDDVPPNTDAVRKNAAKSADTVKPADSGEKSDRGIEEILAAYSGKERK